MALQFRKHIRLPDHDYTHGAYFVTLCTASRAHMFGKIAGTGPAARMELNDAGNIVDECWRAIPDHFPHVHLGQMQVMPDHVHGILVLGTGHGNDNAIVEATRWVAATNAADNIGYPRNGPQRGSLGAVIGAFKSETTKRVNRMNSTIGERLWQPNYHERTIRVNGGEQERIAQYIAQNPMNWR